MKLFGIALVAVAALCGVMTLRAHARRSRIPLPPAARTGSALPVMLWAWEEPEDLRTLDPSQAGVAFLAERVFLGETANSIPRRQPILLAPATYLTAVVRLETTRTFADTPNLRAQTSASILRAAALPGIRGLQIDFDATTSQHAFYADLLHRVRAQLPSGIDLTITALVSWCSPDRSWLSDLPVDAAVPMYFRLGRHAGSWTVQQPLCANALGISIDEPRSAPAAMPNQRRYVFAPRPWTAGQLAEINRNQIPTDQPGAR